MVGRISPKEILVRQSNLIMIGQEPVMLNGSPLLVNGIPQLTGGHEMTVGDVISIILPTKKVDAFNPLKTYILAQRFYKAG